MYKILSVFLGMLIWHSAASASMPNLFQNTTFVMDLSRNMPYPWYVTAADNFVCIHDGSWTLGMTTQYRNKQHKITLMQRVFLPQGGGIYHFSGEIEGDVTKLFALIEFTPRIKPYRIVKILPLAPAEGRWKKFQYKFTIPAGCRSLQLLLEPFARSAGEVILMKKLVFRKDK